MSDAVKALLEELNLERSVPLRDVWAAIEQHKANLANIESLESHNAKLVESRQLMSAERDAALAELEKLRAELAQYSAEMGLCPGRMWAPGVLKRWLEDLASARALFASSQCVDLTKAIFLKVSEDRDQLKARAEKAEAKLAYIGEIVARHGCLCECSCAPETCPNPCLPCRVAEKAGVTL